MNDMTLSDEQMSAVSGAKISEWHEVERPIGRQPIPDWCKGAHVEWMNGVCNAPTVSIKTVGSVYNWDDQRWSMEGVKTYIARHPDGRANVLYHGGAVSMVKMQDQRNEFVQDVLAGRRGELPWVEVKATAKQDGFGGSHYWLKMLDGSDLVLRGPWHGGAPAGYVEVGTVDITSKYFLQPGRYDRNKPWYLRGGGPSVYITEELFLRIMARYCAHVPIARCKHTYGSRLEPFRAEWGMPKAQVYDIELERNRRHEPAGPFWRVYWDGTGRYCGNLRMPTHGFQEGVAP